ncbi:uncharacterized protein BDZ83DRAFT_645352 [Colletotrichum acutatum]|uniref:Uncharacterized protein n=1 Tax=Glomerella acutata TaxID=27357 RepID=A0AAD8U8E6_GLOAC|nr:uncharacterized protein BDZ83DRAFT_645352 [Colletotrichum acutatum]KAK1702315.1 hypothetical protein BDZ83DRAFT_645352 [Colletotrichum acutatum]
MLAPICKIEQEKRNQKHHLKISRFQALLTAVANIQQRIMLGVSFYKHLDQVGRKLSAGPTWWVGIVLCHELWYAAMGILSVVKWLDLSK